MNIVFLVIFIFFFQITYFLFFLFFIRNCQCVVFIIIPVYDNIIKLDLFRKMTSLALLLIETPT